MRAHGRTRDGWALALATLTAAAGVAMAAGGPTPVRPRAAEAQVATDTRQPVSLAPPQRDAVLAEMRRMLGSVSGVLQSLAAGDRAAVEQAARASGMVKAVDPRLQQTLPRPFLELGMSTHQRFDRLADAARSGAPPEEILRALAEVTQGCVACHAMYRF